METDPERLKILDMVPIGLFALDPDLIIRYWNRTLERWTGLSRTEMIGHPVGERYPHLLELRYAGRLEEVFRLGTPAVFSSQLHPYVIPITLPGGCLQCQNVTVTAIQGIGAPQGALVAIEDVTELVARVASYKEMRDRALVEVDHRRRGEAELRRRNQELSVLHTVTTIITSSGSLCDRLTTVLDHLLSFLEFEAGFVHLFYHADGGTGLRVQRGLPDGVSETLQELVSRRNSPGGEMFDDRVVYAEERGDLHEAIRQAGYTAFARIPLIAGETVVGILSVMTAREHAFDVGERRLLGSIGMELGAAVRKGALEAQLQDAYEQANLYLDILTHDVNNTITGISGYAELMAQQIVLPDQQDSLAELQRGIAKAAEIIRNVSTIRQIHELQLALRPIRLDDLVRGEAAVFSHARIVIEVPPLEVLADELLGEVFTNLIGNSLKFGGDGVTVWVRARAGDGVIECSVEDDGPGIPDREKPDLFKRFQSGVRDRSGQGLGLYITRSLIDRYGGICRVDDRVPGRPEEGAAVRFMLPQLSCRMELTGRAELLVQDTTGGEEGLDT